MLIVKIFFILFWMFLVPLLSGTLIVNQWLKNRTDNLFLTITCGYLFMLSSFYLLVIPLLFLKVEFNILVFCWSYIQLVICLLGAMLNFRKFTKIRSSIYCQIKSLPWFTFIVVLLILMQAFILAKYVHIDDDDAFYVATATTAVSTNTISQIDPYTGDPYLYYQMRYVLSPFPIFIATLSKLVMIHPTIFAHTIIPAVFIPLSYLVLALLASLLFPSNKNKQMLFLLFLCILNIWGNVSIYTTSSFLLFRIWQGKAVLANIILPATLIFAYFAMSGKSQFRKWILLLSCSISACLASSMGIILAPIMISCMGIIYFLKTKGIRTLIYAIICCTPCVLCGLAYIFRIFI